MNEEDQAGVRHCWEATELLQAWEHDVQVEASSKARQLFPNLPPLPQLIPAQVADVVPAAADNRDGMETWASRSWRWRTRRSGRLGRLGGGRGAHGGQQL